jgi:GMP synthase (glutamine-hydrolysing)
MTRILTLEFWPTCHLGEITRAFDAHGAHADYHRIEEGDTIPSDHADWDGLVMLGGPQYAEDDEGYPYLADAAALARAFHDVGKPVLGVCLGSQILARALGGRVTKQGWTELGFIELSPTPAAKDDPLLAGIAPTKLVQFHEDTFEIPPGATHLLTGENCANQAYRSGASYGFQCHFECSTDLWKEWLTGMSDHLLATDPDYHANWPQDFEKHEAGSLVFCDIVSRRWLDLVEARLAKAA